MDWYIDAREAEATHELRHEVVAFLARHAAPDTDLMTAELAVGELLGNLARHAPGPAWVSLHWPADTVTLTVTDLGPGITTTPPDEVDLLAESGRGLLIVDALVEQLDARARASGGSRIVAQLAVPRRATASLDPGPSPGPSLPDLAEARPEGGFGRESFLRALVVQLAQAVERTGGPDQAEQAVSQVGADVGGQMEQEYRLAFDVVGRMTSQQVGECLVRLKAAIDGGFLVTELTDERIVLVNTRCPFGPVVQQAPALCRMTSSVFGGIAARNSPDGRAAVVLEERIAVGDPHCRVVVHLTAAPPELVPYAHDYHSLIPLGS